MTDRLRAWRIAAAATTAGATFLNAGVLLGGELGPWRLLTVAALVLSAVSFGWTLGVWLFARATHAHIDALEAEHRRLCAHLAAEYRAWAAHAADDDW